MTATVALRPVRRWIHARQAAHRERGAVLTNLYVGALSLAIIGGVLQRQLTAIFWPADPALSGVAGLALALVYGALLLLALRRLGPVALSRPATYFLLTAPVSRRGLLLPGLRLAAVATALTGAAGAVSVLGQVGTRDALPPMTVALGALAALLVLLIAALAQTDRRGGTTVDRLASLALAIGLAGLVADAAGWTPPALPGPPAAASLVLLAGALALVVLLGFTVVVRGLARTPNDRVLESAQTAGTLFDAAFGMDPSWVTDMVERRYWATRRLRSTRPPARLPLLTGQDLLLTARRLPRLVWLTGATALPLLLTTSPRWLLAGALLAGALTAARTCTATVQTDAGNPVLARLLGLSSRQALYQRFWVPTALAAAWTTLALALLQLTGALPPGPWWALGLAVAPAAGAAALRRARVGFVRNDLLPLETPMGTVSTGPLVNSVAGPDLLLLGLPMVLALAQGQSLPWTSVLLQAAAAVLGARAYLNASTAPTRTELAAR
ncbi:DUF6297 family protein [Actinoplanes sp. DH11]|uniref:DUF6297 family protein n=1 Tax=Actinoplanes sp. DH11 TaxID=2857011 RepID=UPI001E348CE8|nr:DUF6297 family protein [Actinoplanes sp. DH11]